jgi:hypothetical protein
LAKRWGYDYFCTVVSEYVEIALKNKVSLLGKKTCCSCNAINLSAGMSTIINPPALCISFYFLRRLKIDFENNGSLVVVPFVT